MPVAELDRLARERGVTAKTLRRAKEQLGLQYQREGFGHGSRMLSALRSTGPYTPTPLDVGEYGGA